MCVYGLWVSAGVCLCVCVCVCVCVCLCLCVFCVYFVCMCVCILCVCVCVCVCVYMGVYLCMYGCVFRVFICVCLCVHVYEYIHNPQLAIFLQGTVLERNRVVLHSAQQGRGDDQGSQDALLEGLGHGARRRERRPDAAACHSNRAHFEIRHCTLGLIP